MTSPLGIAALVLAILTVGCTREEQRIKPWCVTQDEREAYGACMLAHPFLGSDYCRAPCPEHPVTCRVAFEGTVQECWVAK